MRKILIVDSDEQVTSVLELKLKQNRYNVRTLAGTVNALLVVKEFSPDLIISEMVLPELSGVDFLKRVKMNPESKDIPFIFLSSSRNVEEKILAHEMGAEAFFVKPIFLKVLINRIRDLFEQKNFNAILTLPDESREFKGELVNISLIDLLNIIHENRKSGIIRLTSLTNERAAIFFSEGELVRIEKEGEDCSNGERLLYNLLSWLEGSFVISYSEFDVTSNIESTLERLIVNAVSWLEEYTNELNELPPLDVKLFLDFPKFVDNIPKLPDNIGLILKNIAEDGTRVAEIIERAGEDKKRSIDYLKKLIRAQVITKEKNTGDYVITRPDWFSRLEEAKTIAAEEYIPDIETVAAEEEPIHPYSKEKSKPLEYDPTEEDDSKIIMPPVLQKDFADIPQEIKDVAEPVEQEVHNTAVSLETSAAKTAVVPPVAASVSVAVDTAAAPRKKPEMVAANEEFIKEMYQENNGNTRLIAVIIIAVLALAIAGAVYWFKFRGVSEQQIQPQPEQVKPIPLAITPVKAIVLKPKEPEVKADPYAAMTVDDLIKAGNDSQKVEKFAESAKAYQAAFFKANDTGASKEIIAKILKNLAIAQYSSEAFEPALKSIDNSILIEVTDEKIELKAAILEEMKQYKKAIELYKESMKNPKFKAKAKDWQAAILELVKAESGQK